MPGLFSLYSILIYLHSYLFLTVLTFSLKNTLFHEVELIVDRVAVFIGVCCHLCPFVGSAALGVKKNDREFLQHYFIKIRN